MALKRRRNLHHARRAGRWQGPASSSWAQSLADRERLYRSAFELAGVGMAISTPEGRLSKVNAAFAAMLGYTAQVLEGMPYLALTHPEDVQLSASTCAELLRTPSAVRRFEKRYLHQDGHSIWCEVTTFLLRQQGARPMYFISCVQHIALRKQAEAEARDSAGRLNFALQKIHTGSWTFDLDTHVATSTLEHAKIFGYDAPQTNWSLDRFYAHVIDEDRETVQRKVQSAIAADEAWSIECRIRRCDGVIRWIWVTGAKYKGASSVRRQATGIVQDITERKRAEAETAHLQAQLLQAQRLESVGRFAGGVAHDFNNMLGVILGNVELVEAELPGAERAQGDLLEIRKAARRSADLVARLLAFARQRPIEPRNVDLNEAIFGLLKFVQRLIGEDIVLKWRPAKPLWQVKMDPSQLDQVLVNLCVNARDAISGAGSITISTANCASAELPARAALPGVRGDAFVRLTVTDDGCGMSEDTLEKIFDPFFTTKPVGEGTGLGLAVVYGVVTANCGFIDVTSKLGAGTSFAIYLPRSEAQFNGVALEHAERDAPRGRETILVVEDESALLKATERLLKALGYHVLTAGSPLQALSLAEQYAGAIDLLLTDVVMPEMNGREPADHLSLARPGTKILFMSGYTDKVVLGSGSHLLLKPFSQHSLGSKLREVLDGPAPTSLRASS